MQKENERRLNENGILLNGFINNIMSMGYSDNNYDNLNDYLREIELNEESIKNYDNDICLICLEKYLIHDKICYMPCFHFFHSTCIKSWIKIKRKCPLCNNSI